MKQVSTISDIRSGVAELRAAGKTIAFVPTMGALHEGHLSLMRLAKQKADEVVVSIYVNPTQFGPNEDFDSYPRQMEKDLKACEEEGVSVVFTPNDKIMYGSGERYFGISIDELNEDMDGGSRPSFFEGIALVVNKLFNIIEPDVAVFGQKDIQQFQILSRMVEEFNHDIELVAAPIARANDGLALSSRNAYLSDKERKIAPGLYRALQYVEKQIRDGVDEPKLLLKHQQDELEAKGFKNDYLNVFSMDNMQPVQKLEPGTTYILAGAAYLGKTRLIDNIILDL
ncbi:pantoate--beta-alanine ligase [Gracilimonas sediminicola]|uniref:Pantothenate synthetase n=1 Tax=Gracilimonas sediminicola TaxID=2952158 RepID=A0A9X2L4F9_9BACT|nr:pantoate--beta-alanine ligase [Gracilimonas sediminicola]MCP9291573.1 pantoate--beta-alanine ligase [Gracilimonas sediminicola]